MTQLAQAKKEAKRLYSLAKSNPQSDLNIPSLSHAQKIVAFMNGYNNWHDFEQNLTKKEEIKDFGTIHMDKYIIKNSQTMNYIPLEMEKELQKYHYYMSLGDLKKYKEKLSDFPLEIKNSGVGGIIGYHEVKGTLTTKKYDIHLRARNTTYWGMHGVNGSGIRTVLETVAFQMIEKNCGVIHVHCSGDRFNYSKFYLMCEKSNRSNDMYFLNFSAHNSKQTHSFDPINPMISYKENFLSMLEMSNNNFSEIFYNMCLYCYNQNIAIDSKTLLNLVSLNNLVNYKNHLLKEVFQSQEKEINIYLKNIGVEDNGSFSIDSIKAKSILEHHLSIKECIEYANIIERGEKYGIYSCYAQINLDMILSQNKVLSIMFSDNEDFKKNSQLFMVQLLTMQRVAIKKCGGRIDGSLSELCGFVSSNIFEDIGKIFNPLTLTLFERNLKEEFTRNIINFISDENYDSALKATIYNQHPNSNLLNTILIHFEQHLILRNNSTNCIPPIILQKILHECEHFPNIFYKNNQEIKELSVGHGYYFYMDNKEIEDKIDMKKIGLPNRGFFKKIITYYKSSFSYRDTVLINHAILRQ